MKSKKKILIRFILAVVLLLVTFMYLILSKKIQLNGILADKYEIKGIDVSHYQGEIDWDQMEAQNITFAYIKATEGSSHIDDYFYENWEYIGYTNIYAGAYHFFSFESSGKTQAENYINVVGSLQGKLRPAVDVEYYGNKANEPLDYDMIKGELKVLLKTLEEEYGTKPVIYCTYKAYNDFIKGTFDEYDLWIRNVYITPNLFVKGKWTYWQYSDKGELQGIYGYEKYVDFNVFYGDLDEFIRYNMLRD